MNNRLPEEQPTSYPFHPNNTDYLTLMSEAVARKFAALTERRRKRMIRVAENRTSHVTLVLEDIHDPHNVSACLRSAEAFGVANVKVIDPHGHFKPSTVTRGSDQWLSIESYREADSCLADLKTDGYQIAAGFPPSDQTVSLSHLPVAKPLAVVFGNEHSGISAGLRGHCDVCFTIPMWGMVESLNISVSAAVTMAALVEKGRRQLGEAFLLPPEGVASLLEHWVIRTTKV